MAKHRPDLPAVKIGLRVIPRAKRDAIEGFREEVLRVRVTAAPQDGGANKAVVKLLAKRLGLPLSSVVLARGARSRDKVIEVSGLDLAVVRERLSGSGQGKAK